MSAYFQHHYLSNSDLKRMVQHFDPKPQPDNLEEIFDLGSLIHAVLLEPVRISGPFIATDGSEAAYLLNEDKKITRFTSKQYFLAKTMAETFMRDELCQRLIMWRDFKREHEFYRTGLFGIRDGVRCKADGYSKELSIGLEYKGLAIANDKAFEEAIVRLDYDQGLAWYLDIMRVKQFLIVGASKKDPKKIFKRLVDRNHPYYQSGMVKIEKCVKMYSNLIEV